MFVGYFFAHMFTQLHKTCVLVSWLLKRIVFFFNWYSFCSFWQALWVHEEQTTSIYKPCTVSSTIFFFFVCFLLIWTIVIEAKHCTQSVVIAGVHISYSCEWVSDWVDKWWVRTWQCLTEGTGIKLIMLLCISDTCLLSLCRTCGGLSPEKSHKVSYFFIYCWRTNWSMPNNYCRMQSFVAVFRSNKKSLFFSIPPLFFIYFFISIGWSMCHHVFCFQGIKAHGSATLSSRRQLSECLCSDITWLDMTVSCSGPPWCSR